MRDPDEPDARTIAAAFDRLSSLHDGGGPVSMRSLAGASGWRQPQEPQRSLYSQFAGNPNLRCKS